MARANDRTLLPLDTWARIMGMHPLHFNGVQVQDLAPATTCGSPIMQYAWQTANGVAREDIANAIADAEARIAQYTRFKLLPTFEADERHQWPGGMPPIQSAWNRSWSNAPSIKLDYGNLIAGGVEGRTLSNANAPITYTDADADGYAETATVTVITSISDINEIALFYPNEDGDPAWEIRPINVSILNGVATIRFRREQCVNPGLLEGFGGRSVDGLDSAMFLTAADVYRVWHDPRQQIQFLWANPSWGGCGCATATCATCFLGAQFGCTVVDDYRTGMISASSSAWNSTTETYEPAALAYNRAPDRVRVWYRAGHRNQASKRPFVDMDSRWARAVAYLATSLLTRPMCQCENVTSAVSHWQDDLAKSVASQGAAENYNLDRDLLGNPFGTTRGGIYAWQVFRRESIGEAVLL